LPPYHNDARTTAISTSDEMKLARVL